MIKPSVPPLYGPFSATFGAQTVLSELESIGRSNLTWPASPATELGRTVLLTYIPSFMEIRPLVLEKKILRGFTIYGHGGQLGHVTSIMSSDFHFLVPESFLTKFDLERHSSF